MLETLQSADFIPQLHQMFRIQLDGIEPIDLELVQVSELGAPYSAGRRAPFSLLFLGPLGKQYLRQNTYHVENGHMEALDLFIVPLGLLAGRIQYEVILT